MGSFSSSARIAPDIPSSRIPILPLSWFGLYTEIPHEYWAQFPRISSPRVTAYPKSVAILVPDIPIVSDRCPFPYIGAAGYIKLAPVSGQIFYSEIRMYPAKAPTVMSNV